MAEQKIPGDGVVTGYGTIDGRQVCVFSQDFTVFGGSLSGAFAEKVCKVMDLADEDRMPGDRAQRFGSGARIQEGVVSLAGYADIFLRNVMSSGVVPQISAIMGPCAGGAVYSPAMTDFIVMVRDTSYMFITGPDVIRATTHEEVTMQELGGADTHSMRSGVCHLEADDDEGALLTIRELLSYMPSNNVEDPPFVASSDDPAIGATRRSIRSCPRIRTSLTTWARSSARVVDDGHFFEVQKDYAQNMLIGFARMGGYSVGVVANQPAYLAGCARYRRVGEGARASSASATRSTFRWSRSSTCRDSCPAPQQEFGGIIRHGAKLLYAFCEATVPKVTVITRKAYGGAYDVMSSKHIRGDFNFAYPSAEIAVMGPGAGDQHRVPQRARQRPRMRSPRSARLAEDYRKTFANPFKAAELGYIDEVIMPRDTRPRLIARAQGAREQARQKSAAQARQHPAVNKLAREAAASAPPESCCAQRTRSERYQGRSRCAHG